jgi:hypothetical protein
LGSGVVALILSPRSLEVKTTVSPKTRWPSASVTVAMAVVVEVPLASTELGDTVTVTVVVACGAACEEAARSHRLRSTASATRAVKVPQTLT